MKQNIARYCLAVLTVFLLAGCGLFNDVSSFEQRCRKYSNVDGASTTGYPCACPRATARGIVYEPVSKTAVSYCSITSTNFYECLCGEETFQVPTSGPQR